LTVSTSQSLSIVNNLSYGIISLRTEIEREQAEEALQSSEERFRVLYDNNPLMLFTIDKDCDVLTVNQFGIEQLGYPKEQLVGQPVKNVFHEEDKSLAEEHLKQCFAEPDKVHHWELRKTCQDDSVIWVRETVRVMNDVNSLPIALVVCENITEYKSAEIDLANRTNQHIRNQKILFELAKYDHSNQETPFNHIIKTDAEQLKVERVSVWLFNQDHTEIVCKALYQSGKFKNEELILKSCDYPGYFQALEENGHISANDANTDTSTSEFSDNYLTPLGITSMLDVPILIQGEMVGIICHEHIGPQRNWTVEDEDFANSKSIF